MYREIKIAANSLLATISTRLLNARQKGYVKEILGKMGVRNRVEAISSARENGLL